MISFSKAEKVVLGTICVLTFALGAFVAHKTHATEEGEWVTVFVPDGQKVVTVSDNAPSTCFRLKQFKLKPPSTDVVTTPAPRCTPKGELVVSPSVPCPD